MDPRQLTPKLSVTPQIEPEEVAAIAAAGFGTIICNRPDSEVPLELRADRIAQAAAEAGLEFVVNPVVHTSMTPEIVARQREAIESASAPVLAYCQSGTRSTVLWLLGAAAETPSDELLATAAAAGYQLGALKPQLDQLHNA